MTIRVLIVDDSKAMCLFLRNLLEADPELDVVGYALDPFEARSMIKFLQPDVLTLDVEMPRMDGLTFLRNLMRLRPMPVVMLSSLTAAGAEVTLEALSIGAVDFMVKRHPGSGEQSRRYVEDLVSRVKAAGCANPRRAREACKSVALQPGYAQWRSKVGQLAVLNESVQRLVAIGASTGGPEAVREVLDTMYLPNDSVIVTQHMPARFMGPFAQRLNKLTRFTVVEAENNERLKPGHCYVAAGDSHLVVKGSRENLRLCRDHSAPSSGHRPSVDRMFRSVAQQAASASVGILLTGMGRDGAQGLKAMHDAGAFTLAQDERTSAVWGMPGAAVQLNAADAVLGLSDIGPTLGSLLCSPTDVAHGN